MDKYRHIIRGTLVLAGAFLLFAFLLKVASPSDEVVKPKQKDPAPTESSVTKTPTRTGSITILSGVTNFHVPNIEWKPRDITLADGRTLHYTFGEGNPKEVALSPEEFKKAQDQCGTATDAGYIRSFCSEESGYMSSEVEKYLLLALSDAGWTDLLTLCKENLTHGDVSIDPSDPLRPNFSSVSQSSYTDMDNWITIDDQGRKNLNAGRLLYLMQWLRAGTDASWKDYKGEEPSPYSDKTCVDRYAGDILKNLSLAMQYYTRPLESL